MSSRFPFSIFLQTQTAQRIPKLMAYHSLIKPPESFCLRPISQLFRRYLSDIQLPLFRIPTLAVNDHPHSKKQRQHKPSSTKRCRCGKRGDILWCIFVLKYVAADDTHQVGEGYRDRGEENAAALVRDIVIVPLDTCQHFLS